MIFHPFAVFYLLEKRVQERNGLNGFSQPHLISQDGICVVGPGVAKPVDAFLLIRMQTTARVVQVRGLFLPLLTQL